VASWPRETDAGAGSDAEQAAALSALIALVRAIRNARAEAGIEAGEWLEADLYLPEAATRAAFTAVSEAIARLARIRPVRVHEGPPEGGAAGVAGHLTALSGRDEARLVRGSGQVERERARLEADLGEARAMLEAARARISNQAFVSRAPAHVVEGARARLAELEERVGRLEQRLSDLGR